MENTRIVEKNAAGMRLLRSGRNVEAAGVFREALKDLLNCFVLDSQEDDSAVSHLQSVRSVEVHGRHPSFEKTIDHNSFTFFDKALANEASVDCELIGFKDQNLMSTILLFNLGLCFHISGVNKAEEQQSNLKKALRLYTMATEVLNAENGFLENPLVSLAIANNMGSIYAHFFENDEASQCLAWIRSVLEESCPVKLKESDDYSIFHMNLILLERFDVHVAAAA